MTNTSLFAFYGNIDLIPTDWYHEADATRARDEAAVVVTVAARTIDPDSTPPVGAGRHIAT